MRGDVGIISGQTNNQDAGLGCRIVRTSNGTLYKFYTDIVTDIFWIKSTDGGISWTAPALINANNCGVIGVWYDQWTPGDSGGVIHLGYIDTTAHDILYNSLNTANDTLSGDVQVFNGASLGTNQNSCLSITKSVGGNLYIGFDGDGGTETGFYRSTDSGATWGSRSNVLDGAADYFILLPGNYADNQDIDCIYWDRTADEISLKVYDDSGDSWAETSIATSMVDIGHNVFCGHFSALVRPSDSHILMCAWENRDTATAKLRAWDINGAASITELTNVVSSSTDDQTGCTLCLDSNNTIYVAYCGKTDGSETVGTAEGIYYKRSTDGGTTWSSETTLSSNLRDHVLLNSAPFHDGEPLIEFGVETSTVLDMWLVKQFNVQTVFMNGAFN